MIEEFLVALAGVYDQLQAKTIPRSDETDAISHTEPGMSVSGGSGSTDDVVQEVRGDLEVS